MNRNKIIDVDSKDSINSFVLTSNYNNAYESHLTKGGQFGDIYGYTLVHDAQGRILFNGSGTAADPPPPHPTPPLHHIRHPHPTPPLPPPHALPHKHTNPTPPPP